MQLSPWIIRLFILYQKVIHSVFYNVLVNLILFFTIWQCSHFYCRIFIVIVCIYFVQWRKREQECRNTGHWVFDVWECVCVSEKWLHNVCKFKFIQIEPEQNKAWTVRGLQNKTTVSYWTMLNAFYLRVKVEFFRKVVVMILVAQIMKYLWTPDALC